MRYTVTETQTIVYEWTVDADSEDEALDSAAEGVPGYAVESRFSSETHAALDSDAAAESNV